MMDGRELIHWKPYSEYEWGDGRVTVTQGNESVETARKMLANITRYPWHSCAGSGNSIMTGIATYKMHEHQRIDFPPESYAAKQRAEAEHDYFAGTFIADSNPDYFNQPGRTMMGDDHGVPRDRRKDHRHDHVFLTHAPQIVEWLCDEVERLTAIVEANELGDLI
jgi:hypothetical protein